MQMVAGALPGHGGMCVQLCLKHVKCHGLPGTPLCENELMVIREYLREKKNRWSSKCSALKRISWSSVNIYLCKWSS